MDALTIKNVTKKYERFTLNNISFSVPQGCIMGLIGENGAGKSTLIKTVLDLTHKDRGEVEFYGEHFDSNCAELKEDIGVVFDKLHFNTMFNPKQVNSICAMMYKNWDKDEFMKYLDLFGLREDQKIAKMSKGMKMKLGIAIAMSHKAKLLILDEPTSGLDPIARDELLDFFLDFVQDETHSILFSSHITTDLEKIADYITFIHKGGLLFSKTKDELLYDYRIIRCGEKEFEKLREEKNAIWRRMDYQYEVLLPDGKAAENKYGSLSFERPTIDEIMLLSVKGEMS